MRPTVVRRAACSLLVTGLVFLIPSTAHGGVTEKGATPAVHWGPSSCPQDPRTVHWIRSWLHTCGPRIFDQDGHQVRLTGIELTSMGWGAGPASLGLCGGTWSTPPDFASADIAKWGFNSVELFISWQNLEPWRPTRSHGRLIHHWDQDYLQALDRVIAGFRTHGVAVVLTMLQSRWSAAFRNIPFSNGLVADCGAGMPAWLYPKGGGAKQMVNAEVAFFQNKHNVQAKFLDVWRFLAERYASDPTVVGVLPLFEAYDILTQPYPGTEHVRPSDLRLATFFERIGRAVHSVNPHLLVMFTEQLSRTTHLWALTRRPDIPNGVMTTEFYAGNWIPDGLHRLSEHWARAAAWDVGLWIDEFSAFNYTVPALTPSPNWKADTRAMLAYARAHDISWTIHSYARGAVQSTGDVRKPKAGLLPVLRAGF